MKKLLLVLFFAAAAFSGTTSVRIVNIALSNLNSLPSKQMGVENVIDDTLLYRAWGGKDTGGVLTRWLAKNYNAKVKNIWQDTARGKASYSVRDTSVFQKSDSSYKIADKADRFYFGTQTGTSDIKITDSTKGVILKSTNGTTRKYWRIKIDSTGAITADSAGVN
jgi:hypothetical protein